MAIDWTARPALAERLFDRERLTRLADGLAVALAISLPWSTSATSLIVALWLLALFPVLDRAALYRLLLTPAGGLPVLLWGLGVAGMLWADVTWVERLEGLSPFHKLLCIPILMTQFERSDRAPWLMAGFLGSCALLLALSFALALFPAIPWRETSMRGVPVKNYASQSELFTISAFLAVELARKQWRRTNRVAAFGLAMLALGFIANILLIATTRTALVVLPILVLICGFRLLGWRGAVLALAGAAALGTIAWLSSPFLQMRVDRLLVEVQDYRAANQRSSAGERLEFWRKSINFVAQAPLIGHGTGTITEQFRRAAVGDSGASAVVSANPHNQTLSVAIQLGLAGTAVLFAMWISHLLLFRGDALPAWIGLVVVVQNFIGSLFNSQLFDFTHGGAYVIGVGVCGGVMLAHGRNGHRRALMTGMLSLPERPRILVITLRRLGDVLLTTPLLRTLRRGFSGARIDVLVFAGTEGILKGNPDIDEIATVPLRATLREHLALIRRIGRRYDLAVSTQTGDRPTLLAVLAARQRVGLVPQAGGGHWWKAKAFHHHAVPVNPNNHRVVELLRLGAGLGIDPHLQVVCPAEAAPERPIRRGPYAVIHANPMFRYRRWSDAGWHALALGLVKRGMTLVATGGSDPQERAYLDALWGGAGSPVERLDGQLDWPQLAALLRGAALYIGADTSVTHLAAAAGCPTVVLFGPTDPRLWGPWPADGLNEAWSAAGSIQRRGNVWLVQHVLPCTPCQKEGCERHLDSHATCLDELSAGEVLAAADQALADNAPGRSLAKRA